MTQHRTIGIIGAGKISMALAKHLTRAGYEVLISSSRAPEQFSLILEVMVPGAKGVWTRELIEQSDVVVLALPLSKISTLDADLLRGKLVIDAANHWLEVDGHMPELKEFTGTSSQYVASLLPQARIVKAFNHMGYHDVDQKSRPAGAHDRLAIAIAGESENDLEIVAEIVDAVGFDPVAIGGLADTRILEGGQALFGAAVNATELEKIHRAGPTPSSDLVRTLFV